MAKFVTIGDNHYRVKLYQDGNDVDIMIDGDLVLSIRGSDNEHGHTSGTIQHYVSSASYANDFARDPHSPSYIDIIR